MNRVYNFSAGPAMLPLDVMRQAQSELLDWNNTGMSLMEISHRSPWFKDLAAESVQDMRDLLQIPDNYHVLFLHGGGRSQFAMVPMNLLGDFDRAAYVNCGVWGKLAMSEAQQYCQVKVVADTEEQQYTSIPDPDTWQDYDDCAYLYCVDNETVNGTELTRTPNTGKVPLVSDMSSNLLSRRFDITQYGLVFACAQKNLGPAGITLVIVRDDLLQRGLVKGTPSMFNYQLHVKQQSMLNTSPTYPWYMVGLMLKWMKKQGGLEYFEELNRVKSQKLYEYIDGESFFENTVLPEYRSRMNVVFQLANANLNDAFLQFTAKCGLANLKGHRFVGGMRASLYNAMPEAGVDALIAAMRDFVKEMA